MYTDLKMSIIIPCYNEENFIRKCLESVVNQTLNDLEVIVVDDGSTDSTPSICDEFKSNYPIKVRVIHQANTGQGLARNAGLSIAKGEYIGFVDADDWVDLTMFEKMYNHAKKYDTDVTFCDIKKIVVEEGYEVNELSLPISNGLVDIGTYLKDGLNNAYSMNRIYKRDIWQKHKYKKMLYEDLELMFNIQSNCKRISYVQEFLCTYFKHPGSTTTTYNNIKLLDMISAYRNAVLNCNPNYTNEVTYNIAKRLLRYLNTKELDAFNAEFVDVINELMPFFEYNDYILNDEKVNQILSYKNKSTLPNTICFDNFGVKKKCNMTNWLQYTRNAKYVELDEMLYNIDLSPDFIKDKYNAGDYEFVGNYFALQYLFYNGGIYFDKQFMLDKPIGYLRIKNDFILFDNKDDLNIIAFGMTKGSQNASAIMRLMRDKEKSVYRYLIKEKNINTKIIGDLTIEYEDSNNIL
ncbi:hypothetical protein B7939_04335 [Eggerthia catenaformis]|nr:hypothetical protein B7939_04335 [Eggerthia catenaformis]